MSECSLGLASPEAAVRVKPATIEDLTDLVDLVMELMELQGDFTPDRAAHERGLRLILEEGFKRITLLTDKLSAQSQSFFNRHGFEFSHLIPMRRLIE